MRQTVITIPAIKEIRKKIRVAAYVRVSTSKEDQLNSFAAQYVHYTKLFEDSEFEELVDVYSDEGVSGTTTDHRDGFNRMLDDCEKGLIQKIYVKSVSRFGRNTTESISHIRYLKTLGISVSRLEDIFSRIDEASANIQEFNNQVIRQLVAQIRIDGVDKMTIILTNGYRFTAKL